MLQCNVTNPSTKPAMLLGVCMCGNVIGGTAAISFYCLSACVTLPEMLLNGIFLVCFKTTVAKGVFFILGEDRWCQYTLSLEPASLGFLQRLFCSSQRVLPCLCCFCPPVTWKQSQLGRHSSSSAGALGSITQTTAL